MRSLRFGHWSRATSALGLGSLALSQVAAAQIGISSGIAQVVLVAHAPARAEVEQVHPALHRRAGSLQETSVTLRLGVNAGYRLLAKATPGSRSRVWVRAANGRYQQLLPGEPVVVAQDVGGSGERDCEVQYRVESRQARTRVAPPVLYEVAVNPTL